MLYIALDKAHFSTKKFSNTKMSDKMAYANSVDPDQSSLIRVYTVCHSAKYFKKQLHKKQNLGQNSLE